MSSNKSGTKSRKSISKAKEDKLQNAVACYSESSKSKENVTVTVRFRPLR